MAFSQPHRPDAVTPPTSDGKVKEWRGKNQYEKAARGVALPLGIATPQAVSLVRIRFLPEHLAADVHRGGRLDGAIAVDGALAGEAHLVLVADVLEDVQD